MVKLEGEKFKGREESILAHGPPLPLANLRVGGGGG